MGKRRKYYGINQRSKKICNYCHKEFQVNISNHKRGEGKFCSTQCYHLSKTIHPLTKECPQCKKIFITKYNRGKRKFCSHKCMRYFYHPKIKKSCLFCQKEFISDVSRHKTFCSLRCSSRYFGKKYFTKIKRECMICKTEYWLRKSHIDRSKYCSRKCAGLGTYRKRIKYFKYQISKAISYQKYNYCRFLYS